MYAEDFLGQNQLHDPKAITVVDTVVAYVSHMYWGCPLLTGRQSGLVGIRRGLTRPSVLDRFHDLVSSDHTASRP